jgi:hypothetical protein
MRNAAWTRTKVMMSDTEGGMAEEIPGMPRKFGGPDFARERFNSEIISSITESLIYDSSRRATRLDRVRDRQCLQGEHV